MSGDPPLRDPSRSIIWRAVIETFFKWQEAERIGGPDGGRLTYETLCDFAAEVSARVEAKLEVAKKRDGWVELLTPENPVAPKAPSEQAKPGLRIVKKEKP